MTSNNNGNNEECNPVKKINLESMQTPNKDKDRSAIDNLTSLVDNMCLGSNQKKPEINKKDLTFQLKNTITVPKWLEDCESPFSWHLEQERGLGAEPVILRTLEKLDELLIEEPEFCLQRFVLLLKLILEYYIIGDIGKCCEHMKIIEGCLEEEISRKDPSYQKVKLSLGHVVSATKSHVLYIIGKEEESKKIGDCIIPIKIMANTDKAALNAMKARFFLYSGYENGEDVGAEYARKALELEPENAGLEFLLAKIIRQQRRDVPFSTEVPRDELKLLESAVKRDKNPKYLVYLAQVYRECSTQAFRQYRNHPNFFGELRSSVELMAIRSLEYYKEALSLKPDSPAVLRRVGYGIMNLPKKFADYDMALECLLKSNEISENQITLHMIGTFYHRYGNDNKKALEYFERTAKTVSVAGLCDMIRVKWILNPKYDPCPDLELGLSWKLKKKYHTHLLTQLGSYHLFIRRDLHKAIEYFKQIMLEDKDSPHMTTFKSYFLRMNETIDLYKYIANEALLLIQKQKSSSTVEPETSEEEQAAAQPAAGVGHVEDFLDLISEVRPELMEMTPDKELVPKLIQSASWNRNNQERHDNRDRGGNRGYRGGGSRRNYHGNRGGTGSQDSNERRGRFSVSNQREMGPEGDYRSEGSRERGRRGGRGGFYRGENWNRRQTPRNDEGEDKDQRAHENWRKK